MEVIARGGGAADAVIAAQAVISVLAPEAGGIGGDGFFLVRTKDGAVTAINAAGRTPAGLRGPVRDDGTSVTVPGVVAGWGELARRFGKLPFAVVLEPAVRLARQGCLARPETIRAVQAQRQRLVRGGAREWPFFEANDNATVAQPALADTLASIGEYGARWFYEGPPADAIARAIAGSGGALVREDMTAHASNVSEPLSLSWKGLRIHVQPPMSQGILLLMALAGYDAHRVSTHDLDHVAIELTKGAFEFRSQVSRGTALLAERIEFDLKRAAHRSGPRSYLHTAGAATSDHEGVVVSSLISVFDDFGSAIFVPEGGFVLNNRAAGFTQEPNDVRPNALPVHTLAPILVETENSCFALATPGADGQVQTILQILLGIAVEGLDLPTAIDRARWRSEDGRLLVEERFLARDRLVARGHEVVEQRAGDTRFGAVVCAGVSGNRPFGVADWRRETWAAVS
jgi:gamma-glutamyltranspeptidase/glutathione hydrolase